MQAIQKHFGMAEETKAELESTACTSEDEAMFSDLTFSLEEVQAMTNSQKLTLRKKLLGDFIEIEKLYKTTLDKVKKA